MRNHYALLNLYTANPEGDDDWPAGQCRRLRQEGVYAASGARPLSNQLARTVCYGQTAAQGTCK